MEKPKRNIRSCDLEIADIIDVKTRVGWFSFGLCAIHYNILTEGEIFGRDIDLNPKMPLSQMANWRDHCDESWEP